MPLYGSPLRSGASHFIKKPILDENEIAIAMEAALGNSSLKKTSESLIKRPQKLSNDLDFRCPDGIVLSDSLRAQAKKIAKYKKLPVTIFGETGTGKEEYAKLIHRERCSIEGLLPFVSVNCGNIDDQMASSLLFGHIKGSFTGAVSTTNGYIGDADGGILFLDEIHCLSKSLQQRLLRVLNDGTYERLGDTKQLRSSFMVITASTKNLDLEVESGRFLLDLQMRLTGNDIELPPLRERKEEIPTFVELFFAQERVKVSAEELTKIIKKCQSFYWQGNVRLLQRAIQALIGTTAMCGEPVNVDALPAWKAMFPPASAGIPNEPKKESPKKCDQVAKEIQESILQALQEDRNLHSSMDNYESAVIAAALTRHELLQDVAAALGIPRSTLDNKKKKHNL